MTQIMPAFEAAMDKMEAAGVNLVRINLTEVRSTPGALYSLYNFEPYRELARYLYTHNYTESITDVFSQINFPSVHDFVLPGLGYGIDTPQGNVDAWADYLGTCKRQDHAVK